jgi:hypothetical protein
MAPGRNTMEVSTMGLPRTARSVSPLAVLLCVCGAAQARITPSVSAECAFLNKYLWRGSALTSGAVAQPSVMAGLGMLEAGVWANMDLDDANARPREFTEVDYSATLTIDFAGGEISTGGQMYTYPQGGTERCTELFAGMTGSWLLAPSLTVYRIIDAGDGMYVSAGLGPSIPLGSGSIDVAAAIGWGDRANNEFNYGVATEGLTDMGITLSSDLSLTRFLVARPMIGYTRLIQADIRDIAKDPDNVLFGLSVVTGF